MWIFYNEYVIQVCVAYSLYYNMHKSFNAQCLLTWIVVRKFVLYTSKRVYGRQYEVFI